MADGEGRNAENVSTSTTKSTRRQTALRHNAQTHSGGWAAAVWSLAVTTTALLLVSVVITALVSTTLLGSSTHSQPVTQAGASAALSTHHNKSGVLKAVPERGAAGACDSSSCAEQARLLLRQINSSRDPCDDFYAYVCEDWALTRPLPPGAERLSMDTILVDGYAELLAAELRENATRYPALRFLQDNCLHPQSTLFPTLCAMFLDTIRLKPWMARASTSRHRRPTATEVSRKLAVAFRVLGVDALFRPFVFKGGLSAKRFVGLAEPSTVLMSGPLEKKEYEMVRRALAPLMAFFQNVTDTDLLQFEERLALMLSQPQIDAEALANGTTVKVRDLPVLPNLDWTSFLQSVFDKGLRPITDKTYVKLKSPDYIVRLTRSDLLQFTSELLGYLVFRVMMVLTPLLDDHDARDQLASVSYARHQEFPQVLPQAHYCLLLFDRFEPNLPLHLSRHFAASLIGGENVVADMVSTLRAVLLESVQTRLGLKSSELWAHLRDKLNAVSWEPLSPSALETAAVRAAYVDDVYPRNSQMPAAQLFYNWIRKSHEKKLMSHMNHARGRGKGDASYPGWTGGFLSAESRLVPPYDRLEIPLPVFDLFLNADPALRPLQLARAAPKLYRSLLRAVYHWAYNFEHSVAEDKETGGGSVTHRLDELRLCLERQYSAVAWADRRMQLDASRTSWSDLWDYLALRPALDAFVLFARRVAPDYRLALLEHWDVGQLFFVYYAANHCENSNERFLRRMAALGPHSTAWFRVNGPLRNAPEFAQAFGCKPGTFMNPVDQCVLRE
ncbi:neprilysin-2 [Rhipicephalus sanguineus]|uniref:Uncharacterized protein n=1 Tax=Rhipicephalus sanguineus TaxID=34632 RepID=A0A9D4T0B3_RHISA|nr:neprilysin-2 [Rhipicephalus sanguineus]KAH7962038.1 hypothetical protein HPB52_014011 [Rhipicephalus sanguineus]